MSLGVCTWIISGSGNVAETWWGKKNVDVFLVCSIVMQPVFEENLYADDIIVYDLKVNVSS